MKQQRTTKEDLTQLHAQTGRLTLENEFFRKFAQQGGIAKRKAMIDPKHPLSLSKQAWLLKISRGSVYYLPKPTSDRDLMTMRFIDELHLQFPFIGSRMLRNQLNEMGVKVGRRHVHTLMQRMGILTFAPPGTSKAAP